MAWIRHHDRYGDPKAMNAKQLAEEMKKECCSETK
jgi:hypothetical protein